jgi:undecaprenyl-diphosphatase
MLRAINAVIEQRGLLVGQLLINSQRRVPIDNCQVRLIAIEETPQSSTSGYPMERVLNLRNTVTLVGLVFLWRLYLSSTLQLHPDEAYYWLWSRNLDMSYFDHPPMVAYFIRLTTAISQSELWVRLSGALAMLLLSGLMWRLAMQLFNSTMVAAGSVILFNLYPVTMLGMLVITPDVPVLFFWVIGVCLFWEIIRGQRTWLWYPLGLCFGASLLSKYTAILMPACFLLYLLTTEDRRWLKTIHPYLALLLGLACFLPVVYWNSQHDWASFLFQFKNGLGGETYSFARIAEYLAGQLAVVGPAAWVLGLFAAIIALKHGDKRERLLICTSLPIIIFFALSSFKKVAGPNWPAFAYFSFSILIASYGLGSHAKWRRPLWAASLLVTMAVTAIVTLQASFGLLELGRYAPKLAVTDATNGFHGWRELGDELKKYGPTAIAIVPSHQLGAEIAYYTNEHMITTTARDSRPSHFSVLAKGRDRPVGDRIYVWTDEDLP